LVNGLEGSAVDLSAPDTSQRLAYRLVEPNGRTNLSLAYGAIRFWFKPNWTSVGNGGTKPNPVSRQG
jgi:hypothetical protein